MNKIESYYPIIKAESKEELEHLFLPYYQEIILQDDYLSQIYLQIDRHLKRLMVKGHILYREQKPVWEEKITIIDKLGIIRPATIVKKMGSTNHVYEARINETYIKHRLLFFPVDTDIENIKVPSLIFSYGFSKEDHSYDWTQPLIISSQKTRDDLYSGEKDHSIIGEEL